MIAKYGTSSVYNGYRGVEGRNLFDVFTVQSVGSRMFIEAVMRSHKTGRQLSI